MNLCQLDIKKTNIYDKKLIQLDTTKGVFFSICLWVSRDPGLSLLLSASTSVALLMDVQDHVKLG